MSAASVSPMAIDSPPVEREIARDMVRRSLPAIPVVIGVSAAIWGGDGAFSSAFAIVLVLANFLVAAALLAWGARRSTAAFLGAALLGYLVRLALISAAVLAVKDQPWVDLVPLGLTLVVTHLGLLAWETRHVSASLAYPGLKPGRS